ncbi:required for drug-induced death protein 1-like isoform X1 [Heptranchias perlo]|uniref:required for drug-induced death protein 1-like isoform X1 n=1 Tax=Heptranchias perlo TaxID=212740 RepID=UPI00355A9C95
MSVENMKSRVRMQSALTSFTTFPDKRDKCHVIETDQEDLLPVDQPIKWGKRKHSKTTSKQVNILPPVNETQETADGHQPESFQEPEQLKGTYNSKKVHIAFLPERYEPLIESLGECLNEESKADKKYKRKQKLKKCKKNFLKALRAGWNYFVLGVQEFANNYTMPYAAPFTVIAEMR